MTGTQCSTTIHRSPPCFDVLKGHPEKVTKRRVTRRNPPNVLAHKRLSRSHFPLKKGRLRANSNATHDYPFAAKVRQSQTRISA